MSVTAIVIAESEGALDAKADASGLTIVPGTKQPFDRLSTFTTPARADAGEIDTEDSGWIALAQ